MKKIVLFMAVSLVLPVLSEGTAEARRKRIKRVSSGVKMKCKAHKKGCRFMSNRPFSMKCSYTVSFVAGRRHRRHHKVKTGSVVLAAQSQKHHTIYFGRGRIKRFKNASLVCRRLVLTGRKRIKRASNGVKMKCKAHKKGCRFTSSRPYSMKCSYSVGFVAGKRHRRHHKLKTGSVVLVSQGMTNHTIYFGRGRIKRFKTASLACNRLVVTGRKRIKRLHRGVKMKCGAFSKSCRFKNTRGRFRKCRYSISFVVKGRRRIRHRSATGAVRLRGNGVKSYTFYGGRGRVRRIKSATLVCHRPRRRHRR